MTATVLPPLPSTPGVRFSLYPEQPVYAVSDDGAVWSAFTCRGRFRDGWRQISPYRRPYGSQYMVVCLRGDEGKGRVLCRYVHRMVLETFVGPCPEGMLACHNDGNTANNPLNNLRWDTPAGNMADKDRHGTARRGIHAPNALMGADELLLIFMLAAAGVRHTDIAGVVGLPQTCVSSIIRGRIYKSDTEHLRRAWVAVRRHFGAAGSDRDCLRDIIDLGGI
jgi:hypothetical protein